MNVLEEMQGVAAIVSKIIDEAPMNRETACLAAMIGVLSVARVHRLDEDRLWQLVKQEMPKRATT